MHSHLRILIGILILAAAGLSCKRDKLLEPSAPERPVWVYGLEEGYVIIEGRGATHEEAKEEAFLNLRESIVNAVAVNVSSTVQMDVNEKVIDNLRMFSEKTTINTTVTSDFLQALRGVQLNKATDWYWEKRRTEEKVPYVVYHVKYPFPEKELSKYIAEWEAMDAQLGEALGSLSERADQANSVGDLVALRNEGLRLAQIFNEPRKTLAINTSKRIEATLDDIRVDIMDHEQGQAIATLQSNGRRYRADGMPGFSSECATLRDIRFTEAQLHYIIHYESVFCKGTGNEFIRIETDVDGRSLKAESMIPVDTSLAQLGVNGSLILHRIEQSDLHTWRLPMRLYSDADVEVKEIELLVERVNQRFLAALSKKGRAGLSTYIDQPLSQSLEGKGDHIIEFEAPKYTSNMDDLFNSLFEQEAIYTASGKILYQQKDGEEIRTYHFEGIPVSLK